MAGDGSRNRQQLFLYRFMGCLPNSDALPADYRDGKEIDCVIKTILNKISTERDLEILKKKEDRKKQTV